MKKICKIAVILLIIFSAYSMAFSAKAFDIWEIGNNFLNAGVYNNDIGFNSTGWNIELSQTIDFLWGLGLLVVVVSTVVLGIRYMLVNPNEKSRVKQATTPYIIGVVLIFGAVTIWKLIIDVLEGYMLGK